VSDEPLRCAGALILDDDGRVFVQRRSPHRRLFPNCWDVVGGHLEPGETAEEAMRREVREETGWQVTIVLGSLGEVSYAGDDGRQRIEEDFLVRVDGDLSRPRLEEGRHTEFRWIEEGDLDVVVDSRAPGDLLIRRLLGDGFAAVRRLGF
jgi:8-oxo-dGTP pyrophosphatase MutT (NUDIX family)